MCQSQSSGINNCITKNIKQNKKIETVELFWRFSGRTMPWSLAVNHNLRMNNCTSCIMCAHRMPFSSQNLIFVSARKAWHHHSMTILRSFSWTKIYCQRITWSVMTSTKIPHNRQEILYKVAEPYFSNSWVRNQILEKDQWKTPPSRIDSYACCNSRPVDLDFSALIKWSDDWFYNLFDCWYQ